MSLITSVQSVSRTHMHVSAVVNSFVFNPFKFTVAKKLHLAAMLSILAKPTSLYSTLSLSIFSSIELGRESDSNVKSGGGWREGTKSNEEEGGGHNGKKILSGSAAPSLSCGTARTSDACPAIARASRVYCDFVGAEPMPIATSPSRKPAP